MKRKRDMLDCFMLVLSEKIMNYERTIKLLEETLELGKEIVKEKKSSSTK